ncbi:hypothetical protein [Streptomyces sp. RKAG290]|uniref:hypothetical protein n=1 Tax=Streptomyces sp. RKAG290 TaxID=2888348 RepID=UPI002033419A|nr:hypothetical protein [Streptomyces sp. RKAG290]MCM2415364.1 hypothetical protein [Streptomyces sp. RKAG290]
MVEEAREHGPDAVVQRTPESSRPPSRASEKSEESQKSHASQESGNSQGSAHSTMTPADARAIRFVQDKTELWQRINKIGRLSAMPGFCSAVAAFLDNIEADVRAGQPTTVDGPAIGGIIDGFQHRSIQGHRVQYSWYKRHQDKDGFEDALDRVADASADHGQVWSKMGSAIPTEDANVGRGVVLEASVQGRIFDGLLFGLPTWSSSDALAELWRQLSTSYVQGLTGQVTAHSLDGATDSSVLTALEWPELRTRIESGDADGLVFVVYHATPDPAGGAHVLEPVDSFHVRTQQEFDALPKAPSDDAWRGEQRQIDLEQRAALADVYSREEEIDQLDAFVTQLFGRFGANLRFRASTTPHNTRANSALASPRPESPGTAA